MRKTPQQVKAAKDKTSALTLEPSTPPSWPRLLWPQPQIFPPLPGHAWAQASGFFWIHCTSWRSWSGPNRSGLRKSNRPPYSLSAACMPGPVRSVSFVITSSWNSCGSGLLCNRATTVREIRQKRWNQRHSVTLSIAEGTWSRLRSQASPTRACRGGRDKSHPREHSGKGQNKITQRTLTRRGEAKNRSQGSLPSNYIWPEQKANPLKTWCDRTQGEGQKRSLPCGAHAL